MSEKTTNPRMSGATKTPDRSAEVAFTDGDDHSGRNAETKQTSETHASVSENG